MEIFNENNVINLLLGDQKLEKLDSFKHLGSIIT